MAKTNQIEKEYTNLNLIALLHKEFAFELEAVNNATMITLECQENIIVEAAKHLLKSGGKRIRPLLTILSSYLFGYKEGQSHINLAAATEFIHTATLLHDDVVDESLLRRFHPTVNALWGNQEAILVGDFLFSQAFKLMVETKSLEALETLSVASSIIAAGEIRQLSNKKNGQFLTEDQYFSIIDSKTAELFGAACKVGAIISNVSEENRVDIYQYGKYVGLIFQIRDDIFDYYSKSSQIGKNIGDDFFDCKITLPIIYLRNLCNDSDRKYLENIFELNATRTNDDLAKVIELLKSYNVIDLLEQKIQDLSESANFHLEKISNFLESPKKYMQELIIFAGRREI